MSTAIFWEFIGKLAPRGRRRGTLLPWVASDRCSSPRSDALHDNTNEAMCFGGWRMRRPTVTHPSAASWGTKPVRRWWPHTLKPMDGPILNRLVEMKARCVGTPRGHSSPAFYPDSTRVARVCFVTQQP